MNGVVRFAIFGLATGSLYGLLGLGVIVIHRSSGVVNFAHGGIAVVSGYVYYDVQSHGAPVAVAALAGLTSGALLGLALYLVVIRPLGHASALTKGIATLATLLILQASCTLRYGPQPAVSNSLLPTGGVKLFVHITVDNPIILAIGLALVVGLTMVYRRTRFGIATSAVAENEFAMSLLGHSATRIAAVNWLVGGLLAAVAGVLIAPLVGTTPTQATSLLIPALAVALAGRISSFWMAFGAALLVGIGQSELTRYGTDGFLANLPGLPVALPLLLIIVILYVRGTSMPTRAFVGKKLPKVGTAAISPVALITCAAVAVVLIYTMPTNWLIAMTTGVVAAVLLLSIVVVTGYAGQLSLAQVSIAGVSVLVASKLVASAGWPMWAAAVVGIAAAMPVALFIGLPALRTRGIMLAVVTFGLADSLNSMLFTRSDVNMDGAGITVGDAKVFGWPISEVTHPQRYALFSLLVLVVVGLGVANLRRSRIGKTLLAVRANERASAGLGISVAQAKLYAFVVAGSIAGVGGLLAAWRFPNVLFSNYDAFRSVNAVVGSALGGVGYMSGAVVGGSTTEPGGIGGTIVANLGLGQWLAIISGGLLLVNILFNPDGIVANVIAAAKPLRTAIRRRLPGRPLPTTLAWLLRGQSDYRDLLSHVGEASPRRLTDVLLDVRDLRVQFGATVAVNEISLQVRGGEVCGVIGPNGSGKTTLIDAITGYVSASGSVTLNGRRLRPLRPHRRNRAGVARSFQSLELFEELNVADNLLVGARQSRWWTWLTCFVFPGRARPNDAVIRAVLEFDLADSLDRYPTELPYGKRRLLAISRALATGPRVLLLDEPAAGLDETDRLELQRLVRRLADEWGIAVLLVEHDVALVMNVSDRVVALEFGSKIAEGTPDEVSAHPEVIRAYLGNEQEASHEASNRPPVDLGTGA